MKKRTVNAIKESCFDRGHPVSFFTIIIAVVLIVVMRRDQIHGIELLYWFLDYAFDFIALRWSAEIGRIMILLT